MYPDLRCLRRCCQNRKTYPTYRIFPSCFNGPHAMYVFW